MKAKSARLPVRVAEVLARVYSRVEFAAVRLNFAARRGRPPRTAAPSVLREPRPAGSRSIHLESPEKRFAIRKLTPCLLVPIAGRLERGDPRARCRGEKLRTGDPTSLVGGEDGFVLLVRHSRLSVYQRLKQNTGQVTRDMMRAAGETYSDVILRLAEASP